MIFKLGICPVTLRTETRASMIKNCEDVDVLRSPDQGFKMSTINVCDKAFNFQLVVSNIGVDQVCLPYWSYWGPGILAMLIKNGTTHAYLISFVRDQICLPSFLIAFES